MDVEKWNFCFFIVTLIVVKGITIDNEVTKRPASRIGEYFNTSINTPFMLQEFTTKQGKISSKQTKHEETHIIYRRCISRQHYCNITNIYTKTIKLCHS